MVKCGDNSRFNAEFFSSYVRLSSTGAATTFNVTLLMALVLKNAACDGLSLHFMFDNAIDR